MSTRSYRHIILEGPDGSGKSTLARYLAPILDVPLAPRISDSMTGVRDKNLARYVEQDMSRWANYAPDKPVVGNLASASRNPTPSRIYDRYPLISEPIYGLHVRKGVQAEFATTWYRDWYRSFLALDPLVIWCLPPYDEVAKHVIPGRDMPGVWKNIHPLYQAYRLEALRFTGQSITYNHTIHKPGDLVDRIARHLEI